MRKLRSIPMLVAVALVASMGPMAVTASAGPTDDAVLDAWGTFLPNVPTLQALPAGVLPKQASTDSNSFWVVSTTGGVYAWGANEQGQLGDGTFTSRSTPALVHLPSGEVVAKLQSDLGHVWALTTSGHIYGWGDTRGGVLGVDPGTVSRIGVPVQIDGLPAGVTPVDIALGFAEAYALGSDGNIYSWGINANGQWGNGSVSSARALSPIRATLSAGVNVTSISTGADSAAAITADGGLLMWGYNAHGELGNGTNTIGATVPTAVPMPAGVHVTQVSIGNQYVAALTDDGRIYSWGLNNHGQLGVGDASDRFAPVVTQLPAGVTATAVSAATEGLHSLALTSTGDVYGWGLNTSGQVGPGPADISLPAHIAFASGITPTKVMAGSTVSTAIVRRASQTVTFTSAAPTGAHFGSPAYAVSATASSGLPVTFAVDSTSTPGACSVTGSAVSFAAGGTCVIDANQAGDVHYAPAQAQQVIAVGVTSTDVASSANPSTLGQSVTYTATVSPVPDGGTVGFTDAGTTITGCSAIPVDASGTAHCATTPSGTGDHAIVATYAGDAHYLTSSATLTQSVVEPVGQTVTFTSAAPTGAHFGSPAYAVSATASSGLPVAFAVDSTSTPGACSVTGSAVSFAAGGTCVIDANQAGDVHYAPAQAQQVIAVGVTSTDVASSANPSTLGQSVTYTATVSPVPDGGTVGFTDAGTTITGCSAIPVDASGTAHCATTSSGTGDHAIVATYAGDAHYLTSSATFTQSVRTSFTVSGFTAPIDSPPMINVANAGKTIPVKWRVTDANGVGVSDPAMFVSVTSSTTSCSGSDPIDELEIYSGSSGLQYLGDGYWQFNWKTSKTYAGQCQVMSLNLSDGTGSTHGRIALFRFK